MLRALLVVAPWIAAAHDRVLAELARRRPLSAEIAALRERMEPASPRDRLRTRA